MGWMGQTKTSKRGRRVRPAASTAGKVSPAASRQGTASRKAGHAGEAVITPCAVVGPDGRKRRAFELWAGEVLVARADSRDSLLEYFHRLNAPLENEHWRLRPWYQYPGRRGVARRVREGHDVRDDDTSTDGSDS